MSDTVTLILLLSFAATALVGVIDFLANRRVLRAACFFGGLIAAWAILWMTTGFPYRSLTQSFGQAYIPPLLAVGLMFAGVLLGIAATYIFHSTGQFSWRDLARPLVISPIVLLPLIGSLQDSALQPIQAISLTIIAFQNGFFWQQVLKDAKPNVG